MDFPIELTNNFIAGYEELKQTLKLLLINAQGTFLQSTDIGSRVDVHIDNENLIKIGVKETVEQIPNLLTESIKVEFAENNEARVDLVVKYNDEFIKFLFTI